LAFLDSIPGCKEQTSDKCYFSVPIPIHNTNKHVVQSRSGGMERILDVVKEFKFLRSDSHFINGKYHH